MNLVILSRKDDSESAKYKAAKLSYHYKYYVFAEIELDNGSKMLCASRGSDLLPKLYEAGSKLFQKKFMINDKLLKFYDVVYDGECKESIMYYDAGLKEILIKVFPEEFI